MKSSTRIITAIIVMLAVSVTASLLAVSQKADAQEVTPYPSREKTISVTGMATSLVKPDQLNISFGVETQKPTAKEALDANSNLMNNIISAIKEAGIVESEIGTSSFSIQPVYDSHQDKETGQWIQEIKGYQVSNIVIVKTNKLERSAQIIDNAVNAGANRVDSVSFSLISATQQKLKDDLLEKAVVNAKSRAEKALKPLEYQIIGVKNVSLNEFVIPYQAPVFKGIAMDTAEARAPTPVFSSDQEISTSVQVVFIIGSS